MKLLVDKHWIHRRARNKTSRLDKPQINEMVTKLLRLYINSLRWLTLIVHHISIWLDYRDEFRQTLWVSDAHPCNDTHIPIRICLSENDRSRCDYNAETHYPGAKAHPPWKRGSRSGARPNIVAPRSHYDPPQTSSALQTTSRRQNMIRRRTPSKILYERYNTNTNHGPVSKEWSIIS